MIRIDHRASRLRAVLGGEDIPRTTGGGIALCPAHQRLVADSGGMVQYLAKQVRRRSLKALGIGKCPHCRAVDPYVLKSVNKLRCRSCAKDFSPYGGRREYAQKVAPDVVLRACAMFQQQGDAANISAAARALGIDWRTAKRLHTMTLAGDLGHAAVLRIFDHAIETAKAIGDGNADVR